MKSDDYARTGYASDNILYQRYGGCEMVAPETDSTEQGSAVAEAVKDVRKEVRKEAIGTVAKSIIAAVLSLASAAGLGWWFYLQNKLDEYIASKVDGVPPGAVLAFDGPCPDGKKWEPYNEGRGRVILGTGSILTGAYGNTNQFAVETTPGSRGGTDLQFQGPITGNLDKSALFLTLTAPLNTVVAANGEGGNHALKYYILPPYIALTFCKKK